MIKNLYIFNNLENGSRLVQNQAKSFYEVKAGCFYEVKGISFYEVKAFWPSFGPFSGHSADSCRHCEKSLHFIASPAPSVQSVQPNLKFGCSEYKHL